MNKTYLSLLLISLTMGLGSCALIVAEPTTPQASEQSKVTPPIIAKIQPQETTPKVTITRYQVDAQCQALKPTELTVPQVKSLEKTIETIIGDRSNGDFRIAGYRLALDPTTGVATIDIRLPLDAPRTIHSLSNCEQFALFGELRETLTQNSAWNIKTVQFQLQGQTI